MNEIPRTYICSVSNSRFARIMGYIHELTFVALRSNYKIIITAFLAFVVFSSSITPIYGKTYQEVDQAANSNYNTAKSQYEQAVNFYTSAREDYKTAKNNYIKYKTDENLNVTMDKAKTMLLNASDAMIKYLEMVEKKTATITGITEEDREQALADIRSDVQWLETHKAKIPDATTKEQLINDSNDAKVHWIKARIHTKELIGQVSIFRINWAIDQGKDAANTISEQITVWEGQGKNTSKAKSILKDLNDNITLTEQKRDASQSAYDKIGVSNSNSLSQLDAELIEANKLAKEAQVFVNEANKYIKTTYQDLKSVVKDLR